MNKKFTKNFLLTLLSFLFWLNALSQIVCAKHNISGFEKEYEIANIFNGIDNTTNYGQSKIYITLQNDAIYIQSNFKPNSTFEYPIKIATPAQKGYDKLEQYLENIYFFGNESAPDPSVSEAFFNKIKKNIVLTVDPSVLNSTDFSNLGFENFTNLKIACPDNTERDAKVLLNKEGTVSEFLIKSSDNISLRIKNQDMNLILSDLKKIKRDPEKLKLISLVENRATKKLIEKDLKKRFLPISYDKDILKSTILENKGNFTIILGHVENDNFVTVNNTGEVLFEISLTELTDFQIKNQLSLLLAGCDSGINNGTGTLNSFNSIPFLNGLKRAENTENMEDFLKKISEENFDFVLDETFFIGQAEFNNPESEKQIVEIDIKVYEKSQDNKIEKPSIGTIILLLPSSSKLASITNTIDTTSHGIKNAPSKTNIIPVYNENNRHHNIVLYASLTLVTLGACYVIFKPKKRK